jgi:hypothetical protein
LELLLLQLPPPPVLLLLLLLLQVAEEAWPVPASYVGLRLEQQWHCLVHA